jgi:hypothetical protein
MPSRASGWRSFISLQSHGMDTRRSPTTTSLDTRGCATARPIRMFKGS